MWQRFLEYDTKAHTIKAKIGKLDYIRQTFLCIKGHNQESEKATQRTGENIYKSYI